MDITLAVIGVECPMGRALVHELDERGPDLQALLLLQPEHCQEELIEYDGEKIKVTPLRMRLLGNADVAVFIGYPNTAKKYAEKLVKGGCYVIDATGALASAASLRMITVLVDAIDLQQHQLMSAILQALKDLGVAPVAIQVN